MAFDPNKRILDLKKKYMTLQGKGADKETLNQITYKADAIRDKYGISEDDPAYGNNPDTYSGGITAQSVQPTNQADELMQKWQDTIDRMSNKQSEFIKRIQERSNQYGEKIAEQKRNALQNVIENLQNQQKSGMMGIKNSVQDAEQSLQNSSFQKWLAARQQMANRGLSGSGLASDQNTRLLLDRQRKLAGIYRDANQNEFDLTSRIQQKLNEADNSLSGISASDIADERYQELYSQGKQDLTEQAKLYQKMLSEILPYSKTKMSDQLDYDIDLREIQHDQNELRSENYWKKWEQDLAEREFNKKWTELTPYQKAKIKIERAKVENSGGGENGSSPASILGDNPWDIWWKGDDNEKQQLQDFLKANFPNHPLAKAPVNLNNHKTFQIFKDDFISKIDETDTPNDVYGKALEMLKNGTITADQFENLVREGQKQIKKVGINNHLANRDAYEQGTAYEGYSGDPEIEEYLSQFDPTKDITDSDINEMMNRFAPYQ